MTHYMDEQSRARAGVLSHDLQLPSHGPDRGYAGVDHLWPAGYRRPAVDNEHAALVSVVAGEAPQGPTVLDAHEVLTCFPSTAA